MQSEKSSSIWYNSNWYDESKEFRYIVNMMILRCNRTLYLQVSGFTIMSHMTLLSVGFVKFKSTISFVILMHSADCTDKWIIFLTLEESQWHGLECFKFIYIFSSNMLLTPARQNTVPSY